MRIVIITNSHPTNDIRLFHKMACSLAKLGEVWIIGTLGVSNSSTNPYQIVISSESKWAALYRLYRSAKQLKPDVVICVEPLTVLLGIRLKNKLKAKLVFDVHEFFADAFAERFSKLLRFPLALLYLAAERWLYSKADLATAVNDLILKQLSPGSKSTKTLVLPNYPVKNVWDYNQEIPHTIQPICDMNFDLIYIGGLTPDRGIFKMLKCFLLLKKDIPWLKVLFVGKFFSDELEQKFYDTVNEYHLNSIIYYQSWLPPEKIGVLLKCAKVGLWIFNPENKRMYNAMPLKVLEYLSAGLPVVTVKSPLMNSLIKAHNLGVCTQYDSQALASAISSLLRLPAPEYETMRDRCVQIVEEKYNWEALEPSLLAAIDSLVST